MNICTYIRCAYNYLITGVPKIVPNVMVSTNGSNDTLTLSWGEPCNYHDPIVNYTVSCSGDVCPLNFTTTDNTTRSYTITNLTPMTNYTFSVVATNSIGSGEAGVVMTTTPGKVMDTCVHLCNICTVCTCTYIHIMCMNISCILRCVVCVCVLTMEPL